MLGALSVAQRVDAELAPGTSNKPVVVDALPYALKSSTQGAPSNVFQSYSCAATTDESGPERIFELSLPKDARVTAWVEEAAPVDVDVHLLTDLSVVGGEATNCVSRGNRIAEADMTAGTRFVVVDSFKGAAQAGPFVLHIYAIGDDWAEQVIAQGVRWRARRYPNQSGGPQVTNVLMIDPAASGLRIEAHAATGCQTVQTIGEAVGATAGINGGYFGLGGGCPPVSLLKSGGNLIGTNSQSRGAFGLTAAGKPLIEVVDKGADWPLAEEAHGGGPVLVKAGQATSSSDWAKENFTNSNFNGPNPRSWAGVTGEASIMFGTVDGRRGNAAGMSLGALADWIASSEVGGVEAVNLDGGGSSTMWIAGATPNGVVNYPSDNSSAEEPTHSGSRPCSGGMFVFAQPVNHAPRFQTQAPLNASVGVQYFYDADALDLNVDDVLSFALLDSPNAMTVDAVSGEVRWTPAKSDPPSVNVRLVVSDNAGADTEQAFTLSVAGATGGPDAGVGGGAGVGSDAGAGAAAGRPLGDDEGGCYCRSGTGSAVPRGFWLGLGTLGLLLFRRPRRRRDRRSGT